MIQCRPSFGVTAGVLLLLGSLAIGDEIRAPSCAELAAWSGAVDPDNRWEPFAENNRVWLPNAMSEPAFEVLFGKPALDWTQADVQASRPIWNSCIQRAKKARDGDLRNLLQTTRNYFTNNLRNVARYQDRREARVTRDSRIEAHRSTETTQRQTAPSEAAAAKTQSTPGSTSAPGLRAGVDQLLAAPPSVEGLIALGSLSNLDTGDAKAMRELENQFGYSYGPAGKAAYRIMRELRIRGVTGFDTGERPRLNARLAAIKPEVLEILKGEFSQNPTDLNARRALAQRYEKLMKQLEMALTEEEYHALAEQTRQERRSIVDRAVADAKAQMDQLPATEESIARIDRIVSKTAKRGLDGKQRRDLVSYARSRQRLVANQVLIDVARKELPVLPETLAGIKALNGIGHRMLQGIVQKASPEVIQQYVSASEARLAEIGRVALPEYAKALAQLPETDAGLAQAVREIEDKEGWADMEEQVREQYVTIAKARQAEIADVIEKERAQRNKALDRERSRAIAAGGDPRLVGTAWIDTNNTMKYEFRDEETVFINALGIKAAGTYKVSRNDVVVKGPHGQLVFTLDANRLTGMGATFIKQPD